MSETVENTLSDTANATVRVPANLMGLIRQSYDTREKVLDWLLAIGATAAMAYCFRDEIRSFIAPEITPNAGRPDAPQPSMDIATAFPRGGRGTDIYTYNMPMSRIQKDYAAPSPTAPPQDPSQPPSYDADTAP